MVITYLSNDSVSVKTKTDTVLLGNGVTIGSYAVPGAGEYDVASIQCEGIYLDKATAYFIRTEDLTITYLTDTDKSVTKLDEASAADILVADLRSDAEVDDLKSIVKAVEPFYVLLVGAGATAEMSAALGLSLYESSSLKITRTGLPLEGTFLVPKN